MKPSKLYEALHALIDERVPLHIWGACGVGKSQIVSQVANDLDYDFLDVRAVQLRKGRLALFPGAGASRELARDDDGLLMGLPNWPTLIANLYALKGNVPPEIRTSPKWRRHSVWSIATEMISFGSIP
jgi:hypothetical protein